MIYQAVFVTEIDVKYHCKFYSSYHLFTAFGIVKNEGRTKEEGCVVMCCPYSKSDKKGK
jgi:hypothetical protein